MDDNKLGAAGTTETRRLAGEDVEARPKRKSAVREYVEAIGVAVILALVIRALVTGSAVTSFVLWTSLSRTSISS